MRRPCTAARESPLLSATKEKPSTETLQKKKLSPVDTVGLGVVMKDRASQAVRGKDLNSEAKIEKAHVPSRGPVFSTTSRPRRGLVLFGFYGQ